MLYYMHNNNNYFQCKIYWNKAMTFGVGSIQLSFRTIVFTQYMFQSKLLHFSQIVPRVCTSVLFIIVMSVVNRKRWCMYMFGVYRNECSKHCAAKCAYSTVILRIYRGFHHGLRHLATNYGERHAFSAMHNLSF